MDIDKKSFLTSLLVSVFAAVSLPCYIGITKSTRDSVFPGDNTPLLLDEEKPDTSSLPTTSP